MKTLYILGNGFDIYHGLKTRYADFHQFVSENNSDLENKLENYFAFEVNDTYYWINFESDLRHFDQEAFYSEYNNIDILGENFRPSECYSLEDEINEECENLVQNIKDEFRNWIESVEYPAIETVSSKLIKFNEEAIFINFNYTDTLEEIYRVPPGNILYIHNNATKLDGELIFGHDQIMEKDPMPDELDSDGNSNRTLFTDAQNTARYPFYAFQKATANVLEQHKQFFDQLSDVNEIIVLGHSLGNVDWPYFQTLALNAPEAFFKISYFGEEERDNKMSLVKNMLNIENEKFEMIQIEQLCQTQF